MTIRLFGSPWLPLHRANPVPRPYSLTQVLVNGVFAETHGEFRSRASGSSAKGVSIPFTIISAKVFQTPDLKTIREIRLAPGINLGGEVRNGHVAGSF